MHFLQNCLNRWKEIIFLTLLIRAALFIFPLFFDNNLESFFTRWVRWDGPHYIEIAKNGYQTEGEPALFIVFYPLYPILIRVLSFITPNFQTSAILISTFFSVVTSIILYELTLLDFNKRTALLSVWFLNIFPVSYFLQASYTESLFLSLSLLCLHLYRTSMFISAGVAGAFSTMTRINGLFLFPLLVLETKRLGRSAVAFLLLPVGFLSYLLINKLTFGDFFYFQKPLQSNWYKKLEYPWVGIQNLINTIPDFQNPNFYIYFSEIVAVIFIAIFTTFVFFRVRKSYGIYMFLNLALLTSTGFILSTPRYALILFPVYIALGMIKQKALIILISAIFLSLLFYLTNLYTQGRWVF